MKLKFKVQPYQTQAVTAVVDCFAGQPMSTGITYRIDPGRKAQTSAFEEGFKNADLALTELQVLANIKDVQRRQNLPVSDKLVTSAGCRINLDIEMERFVRLPDVRTGLDHDADGLAEDAPEADRRNLKDAFLRRHQNEFPDELS